jgi:hypothetical protein
MAKYTLYRIEGADRIEVGTFKTLDEGFSAGQDVVHADAEHAYALHLTAARIAPDGRGCVEEAIYRSAWKANSPKFVVAISEPHHVAAAEHLEGCQPWVSRCRTSPRTELGNLARCCDLLR